MKKIHGTYSIENLSITDAVISDDAQISEHKIALTHGTGGLNTSLTQLQSTVTDHGIDNHDPHGGTLYQTVLRTESIETSPSATHTTLPVRNTGAGGITLDVEGTVTAPTATFGALTASDTATFNGQAVFNGQVIFNSNPIQSNATSVDYDVLSITPTTLANPVGLTISPDDEGQPNGLFTYTGDLIRGYKRINSGNTVAFKVDSNGNVDALGGRLTLGSNIYQYSSNKVTADKTQGAPNYVATAADGFKVVPTVDTPTSDKTFVAKKSNGTDETFYANKNGDLWIEKRLAVGSSPWILWDNSDSTIATTASFKYTGATQHFVDAPISIEGAGKTAWKVQNTASSVGFYYGNDVSPKVEFGQNSATFSQGTVTVNNLNVLGASTMLPGALLDGVDVGSHNHSGNAGMGLRLPATSVVGLQEFFDANVETTQDIVGGMFTGNAQGGISAVYNDASGKIDLNINDFTVTLTGDAAGSAAITDLSNISIATTVIDDSHNHSNLTGTSSSTYQLGGGPILQNNSGNLDVRNQFNSGYADIHVGSIYQHGSIVSVEAETMTINDNVVVLNSNVASGAPTEDAGIEVRRGAAFSAALYWREATDKWEAGTAGGTSPIVTEATLASGTNLTAIQDTVGAMVSGNTENGLSVTYSGGKLNFDVNDPVITLTGNVTGSAIMTNLGSVSISTNCNYATSAGSASTAGSATSASTAGYATNAGYATSAGSASTASSAGYASSSGSTDVANRIRWYDPGTRNEGDIWVA